MSILWKKLGKIFLQIFSCALIWCHRKWRGQIFLIFWIVSIPSKAIWRHSNSNMTFYLGTPAAAMRVIQKEKWTVRSKERTEKKDVIPSAENDDRADVGRIWILCSHQVETVYAWWFERMARRAALTMTRLSPAQGDDVIERQVAPLIKRAADTKNRVHFREKFSRGKRLFLKKRKSDSLWETALEFPSAPYQREFSGIVQIDQIKMC